MQEVCPVWHMCSLLMLMAGCMRKQTCAHNKAEHRDQQAIVGRT
jgi:hypothetical protein